MIGDIFNPKERGNWIGLLNAVFGVSAIIGPYFGGWLTDTLGWRWIFYINLPVALLAFVAVAFGLPNVRRVTRHHVDWFGSATFMAGLIPILLAFTWAGSKYGWGSATILGLFGGGALIIVLFVFVERRAAEPILSPKLFKNPHSPRRFS